jgi:hypothetical protein
MIVLPRYEKVIITPPHTASGNLHWCLCSPEWGGYWVVGPNRDGGIDHHFARMMGGWKNFESVLIVRHPFNRLIGLYLHYKWDRQKKGKEFVDWPEFALAVAKKSKKTLISYIFYTPIHDLVRFEIDYVVKFPDIEEDLSRLLGATVKLQPPYHDKPNLNDYYWDINLRMKIVEWGLNDCILYEYDALSFDSE